MHQSSCFSSNADTCSSICWYQTPTNSTRRKTLKTNNLFWIMMLIMPPLCWRPCYEVTECVFCESEFWSNGFACVHAGTSSGVTNHFKTYRLILWRGILGNTRLLQTRHFQGFSLRPSVEWTSLWKHWSSQCGAFSESAFVCLGLTNAKSTTCSKKRDKLKNWGTLVLPLCLNLSFADGMNDALRWYQWLVDKLLGLGVCLQQIQGLHWDMSEAKRHIKLIISVFFF